MARYAVHGMVFVVAVLFAAGCGSSFHDGETNYRVLQTGCEEVVLPTKLGLGWTSLNHRISRWGFLLDEEHCRARNVEVEHVGGSFSDGDIATDEPLVDFGYHVATGEFVAARITIGDVVDTTGGRRGSLSLTREELGLPRDASVVAMLEGVRFNTDIPQGESYPSMYSPARGYTSRGFGARVRVEDPAARVLELAYQIDFRTGGTPDRPFMTAAAKHAAVGARLNVVLIATKGSVREAWSDGPIDGDTPVVADIPLRGTPGGPGVFGLAGFDIQLVFGEYCDTDATCSFNGFCGSNGECVYGHGKRADYLRSAYAAVRMRGWDGESGEATFTVEGAASNHSEQLEYYIQRGHFEAGVVWIQDGELTERNAITKSFSTGVTRLEL